MPTTRTPCSAGSAVWPVGPHSRGGPVVQPRVGVGRLSRGGREAVDPLLASVWRVVRRPCDTWFRKGGVDRSVHDLRARGFGAPRRSGECSASRWMPRST